MIDWHCHILPGLDDGPIDVDESIAMAARLAEFGYKKVCCTPHRIRGYYDHTQQQVREATMLLQADLDNAGVQLDLLPGMEYMLDEAFATSATVPMTLGDTRLVLCEAPQHSEPAVITAGLQRILAAGKVPLIAHPERTAYFYALLTGSAEQEPVVDVTCDARPAEVRPRNLLQRWFSSLRPAVESPPAAPAQCPALPAACLFHANLGSFTGYYGEEIQRRAYQLLKAKAFRCIASDLHDIRSAAQVLARDKFETNPLLQKLAGFDGEVAGPMAESQPGQGELF